MFKNSYDKVVNAEFEYFQFAKKSEDHLYPLIDKAIEDGEEKPVILALIASLPIEDSRFKYLEILARNSVSIHAPEYFIRDFHNEEYYHLKNNLETAEHEHLDEVIKMFNQYISGYELDKISELSSNKYVYNSAKIMIAELLIKYETGSY